MLKLTVPANCLNIKMFMASKPRIGLTMRLEPETRRFYLGRDYCEAVEAAGGIPVHIPLIPKGDYIADCLAGLDGILLPGNDGDIDPSYYNEDPHPKLGRVLPLKDETELLVLAEAERRAMPLFAICFGMQALNVFRGGSLIQDIGSQVENAIKHEQGIPLERNSHRIKISDESRLREFAGVDPDNVKVNSHHHQAIREVGRDLKATAWTNDGIIECIEDIREGRFNIGVQWHPELSWNSDPVSMNLFEIFIESCRE